jgi:ABC-type transporter Mla subunit MlaD
MTQVRGRISHRVTRGRVLLQIKRSINPLVIYVAGLGLAAACAVFIGSNLPGGAGLASHRTVSFIVPDATGVVATRAEIRFKGIPVGTVTAVKLDHGEARLTAAIRTEYGKIYRNARAAVRPNTPLQDMYIDVLDRGTPAAGQVTKNAPLAESRIQSSVNISDVLQAFDADTRTELATTIAQFGRGVEGRGDQLRETFASLVPLLQVAGRVSHQIATRADKTRRLIHNATLLTSELGRRNTEIKTLLGDGASVLKTLQSGTADLDRTLVELPPTLSSLDSSFATVRQALPDVDTALRRLDPVAVTLPAALASVRSVSAEARPAVRALRPAVRSLSPLSAAVLPLSRSTSTAVASLLPQAGAVDHVTRSLASCGVTLQRFFQWTQSVFALGDAHGEGPRGDAALGVDSTSFFRDPRVIEAPTCAGGKAHNGVQPVVRP